MTFQRIALFTFVVAATQNTIVLAQDPFLPDFTAATFSNPLNIDNPYHPLIVGQSRTYIAEETDPETGEVSTETIQIEVLNDTRIIMGIETRVVRDRVIDDELGLPIEDTLDFFAQDDEGNVWYLGEDVTDFIYDEEGNLIETTHPGMCRQALTVRCQVIRCWRTHSQAQPIVRSSTRGKRRTWGKCWESTKHERFPASASSQA